MNQFLKSSLLKTLGLAKVFPTRMTDRSDIWSLLKKLHPLSISRELVRLGPKGDGGYLIPNDLVGIQACFSPGVSVESGFERDCAELGMEVFLADASVDQPTTEHKLFHFTKKFVGATSNNHFMTLDDWVAFSVSETSSDLLLQMDIEGYEYEVFLSVSQALMRRFRIIVAEFHHLDHLWSKQFFHFARGTFEKILQTHTCVHIHPNNCCGSLQKDGLDIPRAMEFTFLRSDRVEHSTHQKNFPNPLDYDNTKNPPIALPKCWYME